MRAFRVIQIVLGFVLIAMVWLNANLATDQKLAFTALIAMLTVDKFISFSKPESAKEENHTNG